MSNFCTRLFHIYWDLCQSTLMTAHSDKNYSSGKSFDQKRCINWILYNMNQSLLLFYSFLRFMRTLW